jgi:two-component system cell cycle response regulator
VRTVRLVAFVGIGLWLVAYQLHVMAFAPHEVLVFSRYVHDVALIALSGLCVWAGWARRADRVAWLLIGAGLLAWTFGEVWYTVVLWDLKTVPVPSLADAGYLAFPPLAATGLVLLLRRGVSRAAAAWPDALIAALPIAALSAAIALHAVFGDLAGGVAAKATALAYPVFDMVLIGVLAGGLAARGWRVERRLAMLGVGIVVFWLADTLWMAQTAAGTYQPGGWFDVGWWLGMYLIALAAWQPASGRPRSEDGELRLIAMPLVFATIGLGLLVYGCIASVGLPAIVLAAASLLAVMARLMLTFGDNLQMLRYSRRDASTDALSGLGNRRALARALDEAVAEGRRVALVLLDLDGFKLYNDTFGHPAGDALLQRLSRSFERHLGGAGTAFRMGGDEFCALLPYDGAALDTIAAGAGAALSEHGEGFEIGCSWGAIAIPDDAAEAEQALQIADQRMYAQKHAGRASAGSQSRDVLLRALVESDPEIGLHLSAVAELAEATARVLGIPTGEIAEIRHAAELHDVGKVAVPDAILRKRGALDAGEWEFIRRHTIIGERIIAAAPALAKVARLVRSSHEHWDGTGYPDGLAGQRIPYGARIVAVADAFDAMTSERPYSPARTPAQAVDELHRCAGSQFDPEIVAAFAEALRSPASLTAHGAPAA